MIVPGPRHWFLPHPLLKVLLDSSSNHFDFMHGGFTPYDSSWVFISMWLYQCVFCFCLFVHGAVRQLFHRVAFQSRPYLGGALVYVHLVPKYIFDGLKTSPLYLVQSCVTKLDGLEGSLGWMGWDGMGENQTLEGSAE
jgi:hypothetical protein